MDAEYTFSKKIGDAELKLLCEKNGQINLINNTPQCNYHVPLTKEELSAFEAMLAVWRDMEKIRKDSERQEKKANVK